MFQKSTDFLISAAPFCHIVQEIAYNSKEPGTSGFCFEALALNALQEAAKSFLIGWFRGMSSVSYYELTGPS